MPLYLNEPVSRDLTREELARVKDLQGQGVVISVMVEVKKVGTLFSTVQIIQPNGVRQNFGVTTELIADATAENEDAEVQDPDGEDGE